MKTKIVKAREVLVDDEDFHLIDRPLGVYVMNGYVHIYIGGRTARLHRVIMGAQSGQLVDHINGNPLDNRRANLRLCNHAENRRNSRLMRKSTSGLKGVYFDGERNIWRSRITVGYKRINLGRFKTAEEAHQAYWRAATKYHGEFARQA